MAVGRARYKTHGLFHHRGRYLAQARCIRQLKIGRVFSIFLLARELALYLVKVLNVSSATRYRK
jgi:hypothetical protein